MVNPTESWQGVRGFRDAHLAALWWAEIERYEYSERDWEAADCAELPDELDYLACAIADDEAAGETYWEWLQYMYEEEIWLPLEQSCTEGILLPMDQRAVRLASCPEELLRRIRWFFECCPAAIKAYLALHTYVAVRSERARRTGNPLWTPQTAPPADPPLPQVRRSFVPRPYTG